MISIKVAYAAPHRQIEIPLRVEPSCTIALAIQRSGILQLFPEISLGRLAVGIYGQRVALDDLLQEGDRIEIYRRLLVDPKRARIVRAKMANAHSKCN